MKISNLQSRYLIPKLFFLAITLLAGSVSSIAQTTSIAIAPNKMNVFYIGVDNPVSIAASSAGDEKITVSINGGGGSVSKVSAGNYIVRVSSVTDDCSINVDVDGKLIGSSKFRVRALPAPAATVGGFASGSNVPFDAFQKQAGLGLYVKDFPFEVKYEVLTYTITLEDNKGGIVEAKCQGSSFSTAARQYIGEYLKPGRTLTIDEIRAKDASGKEVKVPSLVYYIK